MKRKPTLMNGAMVRALLAGTKTQTRRVVKPQPEFTGASYDSFEWYGGKALVAAGYGAPYVHSNWTAVERAMLKVSPYQPGYGLWVRETFAKPASKVLYRADYDTELYDDEDCTKPVKWKPSIFMPRWASRITLEITHVDIERLQEIREDDARAEGCLPVVNADGSVDCGTRKTTFQTLWDSINGKKHPWESNPFVWVISFKRIE